MKPLRPHPRPTHPPPLRRQSKTERLKAQQRKWSRAYYQRARVNRGVHLRAYGGHLQRSYGVSLEDWEAMLIGQAGRCPVCRGELAEPHVDHDHATGSVRSLLCSNCNKGLGLFRDDPELLSAARSYLLGFEAG